MRHGLKCDREFPRPTLSHCMHATWTVVRRELKCDKKTQDRFRVDSEGIKLILIQEGFIILIGLRLSGEVAECEREFSSRQDTDHGQSLQLCEQIGRGAKGTINDKMRSLSQTFKIN